MRARFVATGSGAPIRRAGFCAAILTLAAAACRFTSGLTGESEPDAGDAGSEAGGGGGTCDADLKIAIDNCGACGHVCTPNANAFSTCVDGGCVQTCASGFADCDDAGPTNGCETNVNSARSSCGKCGHDCQGGNCQGGACQPVLLSSVINAPSHIVLDDQNVYGINAYGTITKIGKGGGALTTLASGDTTAQSPPPRIAMANNALYYTSFGIDGGADAGPAGSVSALNLDGGKVQALTQVKDPYAVAASQNYVYWSEGNPSASPYTTSIKRCKLAGCNGNTDQEVGPQSGRISSIAVDANNLVWANAGTPPNTPESAVARCNPGNCNATVFVLASTPPSPTSPFGLTLDKTSVYFTTNSGFVASCPLSGCSGDAARLDSFQYSPHFAATDGNTLYWTNGDGTVRSVPRAGPASSERTLYLNRGSNPWDIAIDGNAIYWTDLNGVPGGPAGASALYKLAR